MRQGIYQTTAADKSYFDLDFKNYILIKWTSEKTTEEVWTLTGYLMILKNNCDFFKSINSIVVIFKSFRNT